MCAPPKNVPQPPRLPPNLHPFAPSYVNLLDDPQALWFSIHHLIKNIPLRKRQTLSVAPLWNSWRASHSSSPLSSSDHPSITAPKAPRFFPLPFVSPWPPLSIQMKIKGEREREWKLGGMAGREGGHGGEEGEEGRMCPLCYPAWEGSSHIRVWKFHCSFLIFAALAQFMWPPPPLENTPSGQSVKLENLLS